MANILYLIGSLCFVAGTLINIVGCGEQPTNPKQTVIVGVVENIIPAPSTYNSERIYIYMKDGKVITADNYNKLTFKKNSLNTIILEDSKILSVSFSEELIYELPK
jgi:co-chaperonin GroES (HSP10)